MRDGTTIPLFIGKNCQNDASDNPGGVVSDGTYYMGGDSYSVEGADDGASNGCSASSDGSSQVYVHDAPVDVEECSNSCCDVVECQKWKDCAPIPGTYCTQAYSGSDKAYCLPRHPGLREEAKTTENSDQLLAIDMSASSVSQQAPLFEFRENTNGETIFEWQKLEKAAIGSHTLHSGLRCNTNSQDGTTFSGLTCRDKGVAIAGTDNECNGKLFQAECCNSNNECGKCLGTPEEGLTGFLWPVTAENGDPICETQERYSLNSLHNGAVLCDEDGDGWIRDDAYSSFKHADIAVRSNAKCVLKVVEKWVLVNEYRQELKVSPKDLSPQDPKTSSDVPAWICPGPVLPCLPLIETAFLDGDNTDDASGVSGNEDDRKGYKLLGGDSDTETVFPPNEMNPMLKSCTSNWVNDGSDYNKNGIQDWEENQDSQWSDTSFEAVYNELQHYTFFEELYTGTLDGTDYRIEERPRCDLGDDWPTKIRLGYNDLDGKTAAESAQWQSCMRAPGAVHPNLQEKSDGKVAVNATKLEEPGYDFSRFYWGTHSDKNYVKPVNTGPKDGSDVRLRKTDNLAYARAVRVAFSGGWCALQSGNKHVGAYGGVGGPDAWAKALGDDSRFDALKNKLDALKVQTFEVDSDGNMAPIDCNGCDWRGMNLYSQFQCVQVGKRGWTDDELANESTQDRPGYEYVLNECTKKTNCTETHRGDCLDCRRLKIQTVGDAACTPSGSATCPEGVNDNENKVGFVSIRYGFEDRPAPTTYAAAKPMPESLFEYTGASLPSNCGTQEGDTRTATWTKDCADIYTVVSSAFVTAPSGGGSYKCLFRLKVDEKTAGSDPIANAVIFGRGETTYSDEARVTVGFP